MNDYKYNFGNNFPVTAFSLKRKIESECSNSLQNYQLELPGSGKEKKQRTSDYTTTNGFHDQTTPFAQMAFDLDKHTITNMGLAVDTSHGANIGASHNTDFFSTYTTETGVKVENEQLAGLLDEQMEQADESMNLVEDTSVQLHQTATDNLVNTVRKSTCEVIIEDRRFLNAPSYCRREGMWDTMLDVYMYHGL